MLSREDREFQIATFQWLLRHFGGDGFFKHAMLVLPTKEFFPSRVTSADEAAYQTFNAVKKWAGMEQWPCRLEPQEKDVEVNMAPALAVQNAPFSPLGTFEARDDNNIVITYNPSVVANPTQLVATFAHELAHYLTATAQEEPPGGWENWEFATDIAATYLEFGVFMANSASNFQQFTEVGSQGWKHSRSGYLSEAEHSYALAIFLRLKKIAPEDALRNLKPSLRESLKKCLKELAATDCINELLTVEHVPPNAEHYR